MKMVSAVEKSSAVKIFGDVFKRALYSSLGETAGEAVLFFLRREMNRDPFEMLWENPGAFYRVMESIFGAGTKVLVAMLITKVNQEYGLSISSERFLDLMRRGDRESIDEIRSYIKRIAESYEK